MARQELKIQQPAFQRILQECGINLNLFNDLTTQMDLSSSSSFIEFDLGDFAHSTLLSSSSL